jgi:hypothetical protein
MTSLRRLSTLAAIAAVLVLGLAGASSASAAEPWWHLNSGVRPATVPSGGEGTLVVRSINLGNAPTAGPATLSMTLPEGVSFVEKEGKPQITFLAFSAPSGINYGPRTFIGSLLQMCSITGRELTCSTESQAFNFEVISALIPYEWLEIRAAVKDEGASSDAEYEVEAAGGGADAVTASQALPIGADTPRFGAEAYSLRPEAQGGDTDSRAAAHPYQLTTDFNLNQNAEVEKGGEGSEDFFVDAPAYPRDLHFRLPPGQVAAAASVPTCSAIDFTAVVGGFANRCPANTAIGVAAVAIDESSNLGLKTFPVPLFNLEPAYGEPARFGFEIAQAPVVLETAVRSGKGQDYGVTVTTADTTQLVNFLSSTVTFWGTPGDPSHDSARGWSCLAGGYSAPPGTPCNSLNQSHPPAFLTLPSDCNAPFSTTVEGSSWAYLNHPSQTLESLTYALEGSGTSAQLTACNQVPFNPVIDAEPTSNAATSPTGLSFDINFEDEGLLNPEGRAQSQVKKAVVTLPEGFTTNPSVAEGLAACSEAEFDAATLEVGSGCSAESKVGEIEVSSPLVKASQILHGGLFVARQHDNPNGNLLTLYLIAREPEIGVMVKQALKVVPDPVTGQLTTEVDNIPQLPFSRFHLFFRQGQRAPLVTPSACGTYTVEADLYPWSNPAVPVHRESSFEITQGPEGLGCPTGGVPPFHPGLEAGTNNNLAGSFSPFYTHITRKDSEQEITHFSIKLPPGVAGKLAGIPECSDAGIAAAKAREHEGGGGEEETSPSCPKASEVGHSLVGSGVGNVLAYAPGKMYLAGPYHGSNISLVSITAAKVGPFDLGTVVVRFALKIDPETAEVSVDGATSDPIPHIVDGIPVHLRDIRAYVDRPQFVFNPTSCARTSTASTILGSGLNFASEADDQPVTVTSPFQAADCAALAFKPKLALSLKGGTKRGAIPAFKAVLTYPKGSNANIASSQVTLPHSEFLEQSHIGTVCTRTQFKEGKIPGEKCPAASIYGRAEAITPILDEPLKGPVYLRSSSHPLPDLVAALHNRQVDIALDGRIDSVENGRIRNTFEAVPDAPVSKFVLEMQGGKKGLLVNSTNICKTKHKAISHFVGQNGKVYDTNPVLAAKCAKAKKHKKSHKRPRG